MSKKDAALYLGVSERQIERLAAQGKVRTRREARLPHQTTAPVLSFREDIEAAKAGTPNYNPTLALTPAEGTAAAKAIRPPEAKPDGSGLVQLLRALAPAPVGPMFVGVEEVVRLSGLSESRVKTLAPLWAKRGDAVRTRHGWLIRRAALDAPLPIASA